MSGDKRTKKKTKQNCEARMKMWLSIPCTRVLSGKIYTVEMTKKEGKWDESTTRRRRFRVGRNSRKREKKKKERNLAFLSEERDCSDCPWAIRFIASTQSPDPDGHTPNRSAPEQAQKKRHNVASIGNNRRLAIPVISLARVDAGKRDISVRDLFALSPFTTLALPTMAKPVEEIKTYPIAERTGPDAKIKPWVDEKGYKDLYDESIRNPDQFWDRVCV
jgi:hypothetical protein